ncbi:putative serine-threonine protein kinase, plant-type [Hibiscus syriacus]|uniref:Serine-threonine protein kinase, plant-type n=1 Tax=Hibiscus syriacus TaxID=106335 RepID=A0A6A2Y1J0_HIBSY|nr:putative serine-threonine protein kinase, plant-type [Hibiscus syriacus]
MTGDTKGDGTQKQTPQQQLSSSPRESFEESSESKQQKHLQQQTSGGVVVTATGPPPFISAPLYVPSSTFEQQQFESVNPKRTRYNSGGSTGQWKLITAESSSSPTTNPFNIQTQPRVIAGSSSDTASPPQSPLPSTTSGGQETCKSEGEQFHHQFRKGKYVSPVWKPYEMLWLARAWRVQYLGGGSDASGSSSRADVAVQQTRGKTRADKDKEVAEFLNKHGINRDAKTAGTKWDNMLGEFRKVCEWERGGEKEQVGKSYFRLSPYERKLHRLPASFDEEVFEELSQFMGPRMRTSPSDDARGFKALPMPPPFKEELPLSARTKQLVPVTSLLGLDTSLVDVGVGGYHSSSSSSMELRRIGKIRLTWEESVNLWAEEGEHHKGRVRLQGSSFLNADELIFFDDAMIACTMETFEDGPLKGFSVDRFLNGQQVKVLGRRKPFPASSSTSGFFERPHPLFVNPLSDATMPPMELQDPTEYYVACLRVPPPTLPSLVELSWHLQEPPPEEYRFPLRRDVYRDLPPGKEALFTASNELLDCRAIVYDLLGPIIRTNPRLSAATATARDSYIGLWDDCINRVVSKFCSVEMVVIRKPASSSTDQPLQDQWPNVTGFVKNFCLWRGEEIDQLREGQLDPSSSIVEKFLWTYMDLPYVLAYYAVGYMVTFCALIRSQDRIMLTDLYSVDLSSPSERLKALVPCWRIAGLLPLLADRCLNNLRNVGSYKQFPFSDFGRIDLGNGNIVEMTPNTVVRSFLSKKKWAAVKDIYDHMLDHRIPHTEFICRASEKDGTLAFKPRGCKFKPLNCDQLVEALKYVTKALVALHDLSFMHRDLCWDKVLRRSDSENEWFVGGFDEAVGAPQIYPHPVAIVDACGRYAPEMGRGLLLDHKLDPLWEPKPKPKLN